MYQQLTMLNGDPQYLSREESWAKFQMMNHCGLPEKFVDLYLVESYLDGTRRDMNQVIINARLKYERYLYEEQRKQDEAEGKKPQTYRSGSKRKLKE